VFHAQAHPGHRRLRAGSSRTTRLAARDRERCRETDHVHVGKCHVPTIGRKRSWQTPTGSTPMPSRAVASHRLGTLEDEAAVADGRHARESGEVVPALSDPGAPGSIAGQMKGTKAFSAHPAGAERTRGLSPGSRRRAFRAARGNADQQCGIRASPARTREPSHSVDGPTCVHAMPSGPLLARVPTQGSACHPPNHSGTPRTLRPI